MEKLRIAEFVTTFVSYPISKKYPNPYAPVVIATQLAEGLTKKGHKVVYFGPRGAKSKKFEVRALDFAPLWKNKISKDKNIETKEKQKIFCLFDQFAITEILREHKKKPFDVLHIHPADRMLPFGLLFPKIQIVYTLHDPISSWQGEMFRMFRSSNQHYVSISKSQRKPAPNLNYIATIYNGTDLSLFPFSPKKGKYLFSAGRILEKKGVYEGIQAAKLAKEDLLIAGFPSKSGDYWEKKIKPCLSSKIRYVGAVPYKELKKYYQNAKAFLMPIKWEEPFGLVMIEAMACGTPVIAFNHGSVPEVVVNGKTGFIVKNVAQMAKAIKRIDEIDRANCRAHVEKKFSLQKMIDDYERVFLEVAGR